MMTKVSTRFAPGGFSKETLSVIRALEDVGTEFRLSSKNHAIGTLPYGLGTVSVPRQYGDPRARKNSEAMMRRALKQVAAHTKDTVEPVVEPVVQTGKGSTTKMPNTTPHIVSEKPWLAHKAASKDGGIMYESKAVVERTWSDGSIDYRCSLEGCDYTSDKPHSVRAHYGRSKDHPNLGTRRGEKEVKGQDYFEPLTHRPSKGRIEAILSILAQHPDAAKDLPLPDLIELILSADMERDPLYERGESVISGMLEGTLTDAQIVEHIRRIVGQPALVDDLRNQVEQLTGALANANAEIARLRSERKALADLLKEETS